MKYLAEKFAGLPQCDMLSFSKIPIIHLPINDSLTGNALKLQSCLIRSAKVWFKNQKLVNICKF